MMSGQGLREFVETSKLMMVVAHQGRKYGMLIDTIIEQIEIIIQPLNPLIRNVRGIRGVAIVPGNQLAFVVEPSEFLEMDHHD